MKKLIIRDGTIVTPYNKFQSDILVCGEQIEAIGRHLMADDAEIINAHGKYVLPGAIDAHTHLAFSFNQTISADDYLAGTRAAACGGVTMVFDFVTQRKGQGIQEAVQPRNELCASQACVDYSFHVALTDLTDAVLEEFAAAAERGLPSYKLFMVYKKDGLMMNDAAIYKALKRSKETGTLISVHAENADIIDMNIQQFIKEHTLTPWHHYLSRPEEVEAEADIRAIHWAKMLNAPLYIVHLANHIGLKAVEDAIREGYEIYAETCPQYLHFTCDVYKRPDGRNFVCSPPIKGGQSRSALWEGIRKGLIHVVATDHCPFTQAQKDWGKDDFTQIPNGCMGIEILYPYMLSAASRGLISIEQAVSLCAFQPARIFGCQAKGSLQPGKDADIVIYDPVPQVVVKQEQMHSNCDYTIWEGMTLQGLITHTYSRGQLVYAHGDFLGQPGWGKFVPCKRNTSCK